MLQKSLCLVAACTLFSAAHAQIVQFGGDGDVKTSTIFYYNQKAQKLVGSLEVIYGAPAWKDEYNGKVESEKDEGFRLGMNGWTRFMNSTPVKMGGVKLDAGSWCLGLAKREGKFVLMVMNAATVAKKNLAPWMTAKIQAKIHVPLSHEKSDKIAKNLQISLKGKTPGKAKFVLHWGPHVLTAAIHAKVPVEKKADFGGGNGGDR